ncbi:MAG: hypothetical protein QW404_03925, partial [Candidatus Nanoarchaeia archaeon]
RIFRSLVEFNILENYFRRTVAAKTEKSSSESTKAREGDERQKELIGILMLKHRRGIQAHSSGSINYSKIEFSQLKDKLVKESASYTDSEGYRHHFMDGGYVVKEKGKSLVISDKHIFHNYLTKALKEYNKAHPNMKVKRFSDLAKKLVPKDFSHSDGSSLIIGSKSQMALAAGDSYLIKQTVYDGAEVGKVVKIGKGVEAEFFLYKIPDSELPKYSYLKDEDFFNPKKKVVGILRTYKPGIDKSERNEYIITPKEVGIDHNVIKQFIPSSGPSRFVPLQMAVNY